MVGENDAGLTHHIHLSQLEGRIRSIVAAIFHDFVVSRIHPTFTDIQDLQSRLPPQAFPMPARTLHRSSLMPAGRHLIAHLSRALVLEPQQFAAEQGEEGSTVTELVKDFPICPLTPFRSMS